MINKDGGTIFRFCEGDTAVMRGDIELMRRVPPVPPPTRENPETYKQLEYVGNFSALFEFLRWYANSHLGTISDSLIYVY